MIKRALLLIAFLTLALGAAKRPPVVSLQTDAVAVAVGHTIEARFTVTVKTGFHVQANPASEQYLISTKLELKPADGVAPGAPVYPKSQPFRLEGSGKDIATYEKTFVITVPIKVDRNAESGKHTLLGVLHYQACDAHTCLFPDSIPVQLEVSVTQS